MAATDIWGDVRTDDGFDSPVGPSDREVVTMLQRVASAQAHLALADRTASEHEGRPRTKFAGDRDRAIENAHADVIWAQASVITERRQGRALKALRLADVREKGILKRYGFSSFREYLDERNATPTADVHLELARREYEAAQSAWEDLQAEFAPTIIIDLTGDEPQVIG